MISTERRLLWPSIIEEKGRNSHEEHRRLVFKNKLGLFLDVSRYLLASDISAHFRALLKLILKIQFQFWSILEPSSIKKEHFVLFELRFRKARKWGEKSLMKELIWNSSGN